MEATVSQAATHLGVSTDTIRRRIRRGQLSAKQVSRPQGHVWMIEIDQTAPPAGRSTDDNNSLMEILRNQVQDLRDQLSDRSREISELHQLLAAKALNPGKSWWRFWA